MRTLTLLLLGCADKVADSAAVVDSDGGADSAAAPIALPDGAVVFAGAALVPSGEAADVVVDGAWIHGVLPAGGVYEGEPGRA